MNINVDQVLAGARHIISYVMGILTVFGIASIGGVNFGALAESFDHISNGIKEISIGLAPLVTAAMAGWAAYKQNHVVKAKEVAAITGVNKVLVDKNAPEPLKVLAADPTVPKVTTAK